MNTIYKGIEMDIYEAISIAVGDLRQLPLAIPGIAFMRFPGVIDWDSPGIFVISDPTKPRKYRVSNSDLEFAVNEWNTRVDEWMHDFM